MIMGIRKIEKENWWDNTISYENIVYDHLLSYGDFENIPDEVIEFASRLMKVAYEELYDYLEKKYDEEYEEK